MIRLNVEKLSFKAHRSGWGYCLSQLQPFYSKSGIFLDSFIEKTFAWDLERVYKTGKTNISYSRPWIGVMHNPPNIPSWFDIYNSPETILGRRVFQESLKTCKCMVTLSEYLQNWLRPRVNVPVISTKHPTEIPQYKWRVSEFKRSSQRPLVQIGYWLRRFDSLSKIKTSHKYQKIWLPSNYKYAQIMLSVSEKSDPHYYENKFNWAGVKMMEHIPNDDYDKLMTSCVVFLDLYDSSANNAVVESIARNTPILVNKIEPVVEYLGEEYPLYFDDLNHAAELLADDDAIINAHAYLKTMDKTWLSGKVFANDLIRKLDEVIL